MLFKINRPCKLNQCRLVKRIDVYKRQPYEFAPSIAKLVLPRSGKPVSFTPAVVPNPLMGPPGGPPIPAPKVDTPALLVSQLSGGVTENPS